MTHTYGHPQDPVSVIISCKTVKYGPVENTVRVHIHPCVLIPLGSPTTGPKRVFRACRRRGGVVRARCGTGGVWGPGGYGEGLYRVLPSTLLEEGPRYSGAGPGRPAGPGVGGTWEPDAQGTHIPTLRARSCPPCGHSLGYARGAASGPIRARFHQ